MARTGAALIPVGKMQGGPRILQIADLSGGHAAFAHQVDQLLVR